MPLLMPRPSGTPAVACLLALALALPAATATLRLPNIYGSHMLLQQGVPAVIWGWGTPGQSVTLTPSFSPTPVSATVTSAGTWRAALPAAPGTTAASTIHIQLGTDSIVLEDVIFGDVFVCSGQSNMEISLLGSRNSTAEIAAASFPNMRIMQVAESPSYYTVTTPQSDLTPSINWTAVTPSVIPSFSAYCYFMGRDVHTSENVNVGLIQSCWGGTDAQVWMSPKALATCNATNSRQLPPATNEAANTANLAMAALQATNTLRADAPTATGRVAGCPTLPSTLWNAMIHPLLPLAVKAGLWDQGESNAGAPVAYVCLLSSLISDWRANWNAAAAKPFDAEFPFVYRQLHAYPSGGILGQMRVTMPAILNTPRTAMTVSYDLGYMASPDGNIHFWNKPNIGYRASLAMRVLAYERNLPFTGPIATRLEVVDYGSGGLVFFCADVSFSNVDASNPLVLKYSVAPLHGVEIACGAGPGAWPLSPWAPVVVTQLNATSLRVNITLDGSEALKAPTALRYAYWDYPPAGLFDSTGLPAWPFILPIPPPPQ